MPIEYVPPAKLSIFGMEIDIALTAQFNPKEIQIEKSITWNPSANKKGDLPDLEFSSGASRTLSLELLFDTYEEAGEGGKPIDVSKSHVSKLMQLISVIDPDAEEGKRRPSVVQVRWEDSVFEGVLQSVSTKYTMFSRCGRPVRATCAIKVLEVKRRFDGKSDSSLSRPPARAHRGW